VGRASRAKKLRRDERARSVELHTLVSGLKLLGDWGRDRDRRLAEATGQWWRGDAVPALVPDWAEDSLGDRLFSDQIQAANLADFSLNSAFLLGVDLASLSTAEEADVVETFLSRVSNETDALWMLFVRAGAQAGDRVEDAARLQLAAFVQGFRSRV